MTVNLLYRNSFLVLVYLISLSLGCILEFNFPVNLSIAVLRCSDLTM